MSLSRGDEYQFPLFGLVLAVELEKVVRVVHRWTEYDYDLPHCHWYRVEDALSGEPIYDEIRNDNLRELTEMEVIAWASRGG